MDIMYKILALLIKLLGLAVFCFIVYMYNSDSQVKQLLDAYGSLLFPQLIVIAVVAIPFLIFMQKRKREQSKE